MGHALWHPGFGARDRRALAQRDVLGHLAKVSAPHAGLRSLPHVGPLARGETPRAECGSRLLVAFPSMPREAIRALDEMRYRCAQMGHCGVEMTCHADRGAEAGMQARIRRL